MKILSRALIHIRSVLDIPGTVELGVIIVPYADCPFESRKNAEKKGVKGLIVISAGFSEAGNEGAELELVSIARKYGMRMIGPNTLGIVNERARLNASIIGRLPHPGSISFITQSGSLGLALAEWTIATELGFM